MPNTVPPATTQERLDEKLRLAAEKSLVNYGFYIGATPHNIDDLQHGDAHAGHQDLHRLQHRRSARRRSGRPRTDLRRDDAADHRPLRGRSDRARRTPSASRGVADVAVHSQIRDHAAALIATRRAIDLAERHRPSVSRAARVDRRRDGCLAILRAITASRSRDHGRGVPASLAVQHRRLRRGSARSRR